MSKNNGHIHLGLLLPENKKVKVKLPELIKDRCRKSNIKITEVDILDDLEAQGPFDVLLHRVIDYHKERKLSYNEAEKMINKAMQYAKQQPEMCVIDCFDLGKNLLDKKFQFELLKKCEMKVEDIIVYVPKSVELNRGTSVEERHRLVAEAGLTFPVLAKPLTTSLEGAHDITIIFNKDHLGDVPVPCLLQEFCNHGGVIYKVFVLGDRFNYCERPSVQDVDCSPSRKNLVFDTRDVCKTGKAFIPEIHGTDPNKRVWLSCDENPDMLNKNVVTALHKRLAELTDLKMYGLDILINKEGNYAIIDLNQFPGYKGIKDEHFAENLVEMVIQCAKK